MVAIAHNIVVLSVGLRLWSSARIYDSTKHVAYTTNEAARLLAIHPVRAEQCRGLNATALPRTSTFSACSFWLLSATSLAPTRYGSIARSLWY